MELLRNVKELGQRFPRGTVLHTLAGGVHVCLWYLLEHESTIEAESIEIACQETMVLAEVVLMTQSSF